MYDTVRRYEGIDKVRSEAIRREVGESLLPALRKLAGFSGCYVFDDGEGESTSVGLVEHAREAGRAYTAAVTKSVPGLA